MDLILKECMDVLLHKEFCVGGRGCKGEVVVGSLFCLYSFAARVGGVKLE